MGYHTIAGPLFHWSDFLFASLDYLGTHPLALALLVTAAFLVVCELCFAFARQTASKRSAKRTLDRLAALTVAQGQQKSTLGAVVAISSRRDGGRVA